MMIACSLRHLVVLLAVGLFATRLDAQEPIAPQPIMIEGAAAHVYKSIDGIDLRLHVFAPPQTNGALRPAIVFFFGGGWTGGMVQQFVPQAKHLAQRGMVAIVADYRVARRHNTTPFAAMADAKSAIRWVRSHAKELGVDPARIAAAGGSSGGHIAASAAVFDAYDESSENTRISSKPSVLVLFNPALDTSGAQNRFGARALEGSVSHHLKRAPPPTIIFHGRADTTVPFERSEGFCAAATKLHGTCTFIGYDGAPHGFFNLRDDDPARKEWYRQTLLEADRFLTKLGYLPSPSPSTTLNR
jgi:acetyl esterase/lipase